MIFQHTYKLILDDQKTETRLPVELGDRLLDEPTRLEVNGRVKWQIGRSYAVQPGKGEKAVGRIKIKGIKKQVLKQMREEDALAEGYQSLDEFRKAWVQTCGDFDPNSAVWVLSFSRVLTADEKVSAARLELENRLQQMATKELTQLNAVGHELGEWVSEKDLWLKNKCGRCKGTVTISVGEMNFVGYEPPLQKEVCLADHPAQLEMINKEWLKKLVEVYAILLNKN